MEIIDTRLDIETTSSSSKIFRPQNSVASSPEPTTATAVHEQGVSWIGPEEPSDIAVTVPEKKLTLFAFRLAFLEKVSTWLGSLAFVSATVVILGGFAFLLDSTDFVFVTVILVIEGTRLYSRSHELELHTQSTYTTDGTNNLRALASCSGFLAKQVTERLLGVEADQAEKMTQRRTGEHKFYVKLTRSRTWNRSEVPVLPYTGLVFISSNVSKLFSGLQLLSALACIVLSLMRIIEPYNGYENTNLANSLTTFYSLAFAEAMLFLVEKAYWEWKVRISEILENVNEECGLERFGMVPITRFFYEVYSRCVNGSVFDGIDMDMISFATKLLESESSDEQLIGAEILCTFSENDDYSDETLQAIEVNSEIVVRLLEMLNWKHPRFQQLRFAAAEILSKLASKKRKSVRVAGILGAMESISSLLESTRIPSEATDEIGADIIHGDEMSSVSWKFNNLGLLLLKRLARDDDSCRKIEETRGLIPKIVDFTRADKRLLEDANAGEPRTLAVKRSLKIIKKLASSTGTTGKNSRREISDVVFTVRNIREMLRHGERHRNLQKLGTEILTLLSMDENATEKIGGTGGILKELLRIFLTDGIPENHSDVRVSAGEAIAMLARGSQANCHRILKSDVLQGLVEALDKPWSRLNAARILRNLCVYSAPQFRQELKEVKSAGVAVLKAIKSEEGKVQEVMLGLAPHSLELMSPEESRIAFDTAGVSVNEVAQKLVETMEKYEQPVSKLPRIRRFAIEVTIQMMKNNPETVETFRDLGMKKELETVSETATELENFDVFSGTVGVAPHCSTIDELIEEALKLLEAR